MAKFKAGDLDLKTGQKINFNDTDDVFMGYDSELYVNSTVSGVWAVDGGHLVVLDQLTQVSGSLSDQINISISGTDTFLGLGDTPTTYSGMSGYVVAVAPGEDELLFTEASTASSIVSGYEPPASGTGNIWYNLNDNGLYYYDDQRYKWLSVNTHTFLYTYNASIGAAYLSVGTVSTNFAHYGIRRPACITAIITEGDSGNATKGFDIIDASGGVETVLKTFYLTDYVYENTTEDVNIEDDSELKIYVHSTAPGIKYPIVQIEIKWRYPE